jgi:hypothetical protein
VRLDRGSATPLLVAIIAVTSLVTLAMSQFAESVIDEHRALTAAEALALAAVIDGDLDEIARQHEVDEFTVDYDDETVTVHVVRHGVSSQSTAVDHRRTLDDSE